MVFPPLFARDDPWFRIGVIVDGLRIEIDENNLPDEWRDQPAQMLRHGTLLAEAQRDEDAARARLDLVRATIERDVRARPRRHGLDKPTEAAVAAAVVCSPEYQEAEKARAEASHRVRVFRAACDALAHRKSALQGMTDLFLRQWYADPVEGRMGREMKTVPEKKFKRRR